MSRYVDLAGMRFGKLVAVRHVGCVDKGNGRKVSSWLCKCDCGNEKIVAAGHLKEGRVRSCGCAASETIEKKRMRLEGMQFGEWTVLRHVRGKKWICKCSCGTEKEVSSDHLLSGVTKSCGCKRYRDISNEKFGRLQPIKYVGESMWICQCDCGNEITVSSGYLTSKTKQKSCGCVQREKSLGLNKKAKRKLYIMWWDMLNRCNNLQAANYKNYGARGISICHEWFDFITFGNWAINNGFDAKLGRDCTIDRIDNDGNYEPMNCRITTQKVQANNTRRNHFLTFNEETLSIAQWAEKLNISSCKLYYRANNGYSDEEVFEGAKGQ